MNLSAEELYNRFVNRKDVFAEQMTSGAYIPVKREITIKDIEEHIEGKKTIGLYCLTPDNLVKWACVDMDLSERCPICTGKGDTKGDGVWICGEPTCFKKWAGSSLNSLEEESDAIFNLFPEFDRMKESSGRRGYHIWVFFEKPEFASYAQRLVKSRLNTKGLLKFEVFPKQTELGPTRLYGNLVKMPMGKHKKSGKFSEIIRYSEAK